MIRVALARLRSPRNLPGFGQVEKFATPGMYVTDGCLVVPGRPGVVLPLDLVGPMVAEPEATPELAGVHVVAAAPIPAPANRRRAAKEA
jgi:hypothetical protein